MSEKNKQILSSKEAAEYLDLSDSWLQKSRVKGNGPKFHKPAGKVFYLVSDLDAWIESGRYSSTSQYLKGGDDAE